MLAKDEHRARKVFVIKIWHIIKWHQETSLRRQTMFVIVRKKYVFNFRLNRGCAIYVFYPRREIGRILTCFHRVFFSIFIICYSHSPVTICHCSHFDAQGTGRLHSLWALSAFLIVDLFICDKGPQAIDTSHKQYNNNYKICTGDEDEQAYNANYKTTQDISIV